MSMDEDDQENGTTASVADENNVLEPDNAAQDNTNDGDIELLVNNDDEEEDESLSDSVKEDDIQNDGSLKESDENSSEQENTKPTRAQIVKMTCYPQGFVKEAVPLLLCLVALILTFVGSWDCSYFHGANISFTGGSYGLWTLEDIEGKCQRWDVLFYSYRLDGFMISARVTSMASMLIGLGLVAAMGQATQLHLVSWMIGLAAFISFLISVTGHSIYNVWIIFFLASFIIFILICRALFVHPVHRQISPRGVKIVAGFVFLCGLCTILTLVVLRSDYCTCNKMTAEELNGRDPGNEVCDEKCTMGTAGYLCIAATLFWFLAVFAVLKLGVQPEIVHDEEFVRHFAHYSNSSFVTRVKNTHTKGVTRAKQLGSDVMKKKKKDGSSCDAEIAATAAASESGNMDEENDAAEIGNDEDEPVKRRRCQKICCDYRVTERSRSERWAFWCFRVALGFMVGVYVFLVVLLVGSRIENTKAAKAPDTSYNFITDVVCAFNPLNASEPFETFATKEHAHAKNYAVAHCGACGVCSNPHDIDIYVETRKTIAKKTKKCGATAMLGSYGALVKCLEGRIGFTRPCTRCWADNVKSTGTNCLFTCMITMFTGFMSDNNVPGSGDQGWLNQCLFCDEKISGPAFVACSGVARRRLGITSEIMRNPAEQCRNTDVNWDNENPFQ